MGAEISGLQHNVASETKLTIAEASRKRFKTKTGSIPHGTWTKPQ